MGPNKSEEMNYIIPNSWKKLGNYKKAVLGVNRFP